jgi:hypothetical protein
MKEEEVKKLLKSHNKTWKGFKEWMKGQTVGVNPDGSIIYYSWDVERYLEGRPIID